MKVLISMTSDGLNTPRLDNFDLTADRVRDAWVGWRVTPWEMKGEGGGRYGG